MASACVTGSEIIHKEAAPRSRGSHPSQTQVIKPAKTAIIMVRRHERLYHLNVLVWLDAAGKFISCNRKSPTNCQRRNSGRELSNRARLGSSAEHAVRKHPNGQTIPSY